MQQMFMVLSLVVNSMFSMATVQKVVKKIAEILLRGSSLQPPSL